MKLLLVGATALILSAGACKTTKESSSETTSNSTTSESAEAVTGSVVITSTANIDAGEAQNDMNNKESQVCRLLISFISIGEGTDPEALEIMKSVVGKYEVKTGKIFEMEAIPWGREGEVDYCFMLNELDEQDQVALVTEMMDAMAAHKLIQISENKASMYKR